MLSVLQCISNSIRNVFIPEIMLEGIVAFRSPRKLRQPAAGGARSGSFEEDLSENPPRTESFSLYSLGFDPPGGEMG